MSVTVIKLTHRILALRPDVQASMNGRILSSVLCMKCGHYQATLPAVFAFDPYDYCEACWRQDSLVYGFKQGKP